MVPRISVRSKILSKLVCAGKRGIARSRELGTSFEGNKINMCDVLSCFLVTFLLLLLLLSNPERVAIHPHYFIGLVTHILDMPRHISFCCLLPRRFLASLSRIGLQPQPDSAYLSSSRVSPVAKHAFHVCQDSVPLPNLQTFCVISHSSYTHTYQVFTLYMQTCPTTACALITGNRSPPPPTTNPIVKKDTK